MSSSTRKPSGYASVKVTGLCAAILVLLLGGCSPGGGSPIERAEDRRLTDSSVLMEALAAGDPATRARAALAMGRIQHEGYTQVLIGAAAPSEPDSVRAAALFALGQFGLATAARPSEEALATCSDAAVESDAAVVALAVEALGKLAHASSAPLLTASLGHPDPAVRAEAAHALFRLRFVPVWRGEADTAPELAEEAVTALIAALSDTDPGVRRASAHAFARHAEARAIEALQEALADEDEWVRLFALRGLGRIADPAAAEAILPLIAEGNPRIRTAAVDALAAAGAVARMPWKAVSDESFHVRAAVARAWAGADDERSMEFLARLAQDPSPTVKTAAIEASAARAGDAYIVGVDFHMKDQDPTVRAAVARATAALPERGVEYAIKALGDDDIRVRTAALGALEGRAGMGRHIAEALGADDLALRGTAVGLVAKSDMPNKVAVLAGAYEGSAGDAWVEIRESIVDAVAGIDPAASFIEEAYQKDPVASVRARARVALEKHGVELPNAKPAEVVPSRWLGTSFEEDPVVVLEMPQGEIEIRCFAADAPVHVAGFVNRVRDGFYDGLAWHRVVSNFVVQGGDPRGDGWGSGGVVLRDEINRKRFGRGTVGMPKSGKDTGGCQLFITHVPTPHLDGNYTIFGQVVRGMDVVDGIEVGSTIQRAYLK